MSMSKSFFETVYGNLTEEEKELKKNRNERSETIKRMYYETINE